METNKDEKQRLESWERESIARWEGLTAQGKFPSQSGVWIGSYLVSSENSTIASARTLQETLVALKPPRRLPFSCGSPEVFNDVVESLCVPDGQSRAEFWRASQEGMVFGAQAFQEDLVAASTGGLRPQTHLSVRSIDRQAGGFLAHAARFADAASEGSAKTVLMRMQWRGLKGRVLSRFGCNGDQIFDQDETYQYEGVGVVEAWGDDSERLRTNKIRSDLVQLVFQLTEDLHSAFKSVVRQVRFDPRLTQVAKDLADLQRWLEADV